MDENANHALMMSFGLFVLIIALTITMYMFSTVTNVAEKLIYYSDSTSYYEEIKYVMENDDPNINPSVERYVDVDTIIPTLYRYNKENFCVKIYDATTIGKEEDGSPKLIQVFDRNIENIVHTAVSDTKATETATENPSKDNYAYKKIFDEKSEDGDFRRLYMFGAPWTGSAENIKKRIDYYISGTAGYIDTTYVDYRDNAFALALENSKLSDSTIKFKERFISYSYSGDTYTTEDDDLLVTVDANDKIIIIYTIID